MNSLSANAVAHNHERWWHPQSSFHLVSCSGSDEHRIFHVSLVSKQLNNVQKWHKWLRRSSLWRLIDPLAMFLLTISADNIPNHPSNEFKRASLRQCTWFKARGFWLVLFRGSRFDWLIRGWRHEHRFSMKYK